MTKRLDVFSLKGGVGKTTVSVFLARTLAHAAAAPVLLVDLDLTGTCVGDLLENWAFPTWPVNPNLVDLVCGRPELLPEALEKHARVYWWRGAQPERSSRMTGRPCAVRSPCWRP